MNNQGRTIQLLWLTLITVLAVLPWGMSAADENSEGHVADGLVDVPAVRFVTTSVKPWGIHSAGVNKGLLVAVIEALERETRIPVINELQPYPRVAHSLHSGQTDLAIVFDSDYTRKAAIHIGHVVTTRMIAVARTGMAPLQSVGELEGKVVGVIRGSKYGPEFDEESNFKRIQVSTMRQGLTLLLRERIDVMVGTDQSLFWAIKEMDLGARHLVKVLVLEGSSGSLYMSRQSERQDLIPVYREALQTLRDNGTFENIFDPRYEWGNSELPD